MANLQIEQTPICALRPQRQNARTHSNRQLRQIADSIQRFGFCNPILVDDDLTILAGHGRVEAAKLLGLTSVPTVRLSHLSETDIGPMSLPIIAWPKKLVGIATCWPVSCKT
jgi:ParB-like chromosome segregation protein Spo0J